MKKLALIVCLLMSAVGYAQTDYYAPQTADSVKATHVMTKQESSDARKRERQARKAQRQQGKHHGTHCYCPYQQSTTVWHDIWNDGIVGTCRAVFQSTLKPQVLGQAVGAVQGATNDSPLPTIAATTATGLAISEVHKSRRHHRSRRVPEAGRECNCDPCPYHGQRYHAAQGTK